ncbi:MAG: 50S ribosomal protein L24 [Gemmatimonadota bacterium]|nr:50S ribosomal protein L24 [Gemmatimonadota bacterium]
MRRRVHLKSKRVRNGPVARIKTAITKGDRVKVVRGDDKGREGTVLSVDRKRARVLVEGVNIVKRHRRGNQNEESAIIEKPAAIAISNVMLMDPKSGNPTRIRHKRDKDGMVERISTKSGQSIPRMT